VGRAFNDEARSEFGFFVSIAFEFCAYAALTSIAAFKVKELRP
jgi:hypothetical protein